MKTDYRGTEAQSGNKGKGLIHASFDSSLKK